MQRKTIVISIIVIVVLVLAVVLYSIFSIGKSDVSVVPSSEVTLPSAGTGSIPTTAQSPFSTVPAQKISSNLVQISTGPIVPGMIVTNTPFSATSTSPSGNIIYIDRQSGNIFSYNTVSGTITRTNNQTLPGIMSAVWLPDASRAFVRFLSGTDFSTINTYILPARADSSKKGSFLPQNISDISVSSAGILTLASDTNGSSASLQNSDGTNAKTVFSTPLSSLRTSFFGSSSYIAYTKPSSLLPGYAFFINSRGNFSSIAGPLTGLVALPGHTGKVVLISYTDGAGTMRLELVNTSSGNTIDLPLGTIADKCVWTIDDANLYCGIPQSPSSDNSYPDDWYQGVASFSDRIWKINVTGRFAQLILDFPKETETRLDVESIAIDPLATTLTFLNKNDGSLWMYRL